MDGEVKVQQKDYVERLKETIDWLPTTMRRTIGLPMMGALSIRRRLEREESLGGLLYDLPIVGSSGTTTGEARATGEIPEELLDPDTLAFFADDVLDSGVSLAQWALARQDYRTKTNGPDEVAHPSYSDSEAFMDKIRLSRSGKLSLGEEDKFWKEVADLLWRENIVVSTLYTKNSSLSNALLQRTVQGLGSAERKEREKASAQLQMLAKTVPIDKHYWIIGGVGDWDVPQLDMKVHGDILLARLSESGFAEELDNWGISRLDLRVFAGLRDLCAYNPDGLKAEIAVERLYEFIGGLIMDYARARREAELA